MCQYCFDSVSKGMDKRGGRTRLKREEAGQRMEEKKGRPSTKQRERVPFPSLSSICHEMPCGRCILVEEKYLFSTLNEHHLCLLGGPTPGKSIAYKSRGSVLREKRRLQRLCQNVEAHASAASYRNAGSLKPLPLVRRSG